MNPLSPSDDEQLILKQSEEDLIDRAADEILERYREAFEELAR